MTRFLNLLATAEYGVEVPYAHGYTAYVSSDEERGGFWVSYCQGMMPPHATERAATAEEAAALVAQVADLNDAREIERD